MDLLIIGSTSFKRFLQAQDSAQDDTINQFNDVEEVLQIRLLQKIIWEQSLKIITLRMVQIITKTYRKPFRSQR